LDDRIYAFSNFNGPSRTLACNGILYLTIRNHLFKYDGSEIELMHVGRAPIISLSCDRVNNLWVGYLNSGFDRLSPESFTNNLSLPQLDSFSITSVLNDNDGGLWITTLENGVYYFPNLEIINQSFGVNTKIRKVFSTSNIVAIGTQQGSLLLYNPSQANKLVEKKFNAPIWSFFIDSFGKIWLYTDSELYILDSNLKQIRMHDADAQNFIPDSDGLYINGGYRVEKFNWNGDLLSKQPLPYI